MKKYLLTGFILLLPIVLTIMVVVFLLDLFTAPFVPIVRTILESLPFSLPSFAVTLLSKIFGLFLVCCLILFLGWITTHFFLQKIIQITDQILSKIPLIKTIYNVSKDVFSALFSTKGNQAFKEVVTVPFPHPPNRCLGFSTGDAIEECQKGENRLIAVFTPTAPHPISGFLFLIPEKDVHSTNLSKEDAVKLLVSCGAVQPDKK